MSEANEAISTPSNVVVDSTDVEPSAFAMRTVTEVDTSHEMEQLRPAESAETAAAAVDGPVAAAAPVEAVEEVPQCVVCLDSECTHTFVPCKHRVTCKDCAQRLVDEGNTKCIVCRALVECVESPTGEPLIRHYFAGLRSVAARQREVEREETMTERVARIALYFTYFAIVVAVGLCMWYARHNRNTSKSGVEVITELVYIALALSSVPWILTAILCRTQYVIWYMMLDGIANALLVGGMIVCCIFLLIFDTIELWMVFVLFMLVPASLMLAMSSVLGSVQAAFSTLSFWILKSNLAASMCVACLLAAFAANLNGPLLVTIYCLQYSRSVCGESEESVQLVGLMSLVYAVGVWMLITTCARIVVVRTTDDDGTTPPRAPTVTPDARVL